MNYLLVCQGPNRFDPAKKMCIRLIRFAVDQYLLLLYYYLPNAKGRDQEVMKPLLHVHACLSHFLHKPL